MDNDQRWAHLELIEPAGSGGFGEVYRAWDPILEREVALKLVDARRYGQDPSSLLSEGRLLAQVHHPNVVVVYGAQRIGDVVGIWSEFLHGRTLADIVAQDGPLSAQEAATVGGSLARALSAVHARGLLHRDIKATNVIREKGGRIVLLDFGAGRPLDEHGDDLVGTPLYMAPEIFDGATASVRSEIYSMGVLLYFLVTGRYPVTGTTGGELRQRIRSGERRLLRDERPDLPEGFVQVVEKAISLNPTKRYESAGQLEAALTASMGLSDPSVSADPPARKPLLRPSNAKLAAIVGIVVLGLVLFQALRPSIRGPDAGGPGTPVVLLTPIKNFSGDPGLDYVTAGLSDIVVTQLAGVPDLVVSTEMPVEGPGDPTPRIEGSMMRFDDTLQISLRLTGGPGGEAPRAAAWSRTVRSTVDDLFGLQAKVMSAITEGMASRGVISPPQVVALRERLDRLPTTSPEAFDQWSRGQAIIHQTDITDIDRAEQHFRSAIALDPEFALAHASLGRVLWIRFERTRDQRFATEAFESTNEAVRLDPDLPTVRLALAQVLHGRGRSEEALDEIERLLEQQPAAAEALRLRGTILSEQGRHEQAFAAFRQALEIQPHSATTYAGLGTAYWDARDYAGAIDAFREAVALEPTARSYSRLATAYQADGRSDEAMEVYQTILEIEETPAVLSNIGTLHFAAGDYEQAAQHYRRAVELGPTQPGSHRNLGDALVRLGETDAARTAFLEAARLAQAELEVNPEDDAARAFVALCYAKAGREQEARRQLQRVAENHRIDIVFRRAATRALLGDLDGSILELRRAKQAGYSVSGVMNDFDYENLWGDRRLAALVE